MKTALTSNLDLGQISRQLDTRIADRLHAVVMDAKYAPEAKPPNEKVSYPEGESASRRG